MPYGHLLDNTLNNIKHAFLLYSPELWPNTAIRDLPSFRGAQGAPRNSDTAVLPRGKFSGPPYGEHNLAYQEYLGVYG